MAAKKKPSSKSASKTVSSTLEEVYKQTDIPDADDSMDWLSDYCHENASGFIEQWAKDNEIEDEIPESVREAVLEKIEEEAGKDFWRYMRGRLLEAIELSAQQAISSTKAQGALDSPDEEKGVVSIVVHAPFLKIWRDAVEGVGYAAWGGDEKLGDVKSLTFVLQVLDDIAEVYGHKSIARLYEGTADDRFEPETGRYHELSRIADKALEKAAEEARKAEKIMRT